MSMTENEAIKLMLNEIVCINTADHNECNRDCANCSLVKETNELLEGYNMAIKALEEIQQYRAIGTVEEVTKEYNIPIIHGKAELELHDKQIRVKAIDEFAERLYRKIADSDLNQYKDNVTDMIDKIAEQLKGGADEV